MDGRAIVIAMLLMVFSTFTIFTCVLIQEGLSSEILSSIDNVSKTVLDNVTHEAVITNRITQYNEAKVDYDVIFLVVFVSLELSAITLAILSPKLPNLSFFTFLFFGTILLLFVYNIIIEFNNYLYNDLILTLFPSVVFTMPFYNYFLGNQMFVFGLNIIILLLLNALFGRKEVNSAFVSGGALEWKLLNCLDYV